MTIRREIMRLLYQGEWTAGEISRAVRISQKEVYPHLEHIMQSLRGDFSIVPAAVPVMRVHLQQKKSGSISQPLPAVQERTY